MENNKSPGLDGLSTNFYYSFTIYTCGQFCESQRLAPAFIPLQHGLRQGCALSMPLYVVTAEILATHIRSHPNITGLQHPDSQPTISQYADDTTLLLADDISITNAFKIFQAYEEASGAKINLHKCKGLWCGSFLQHGNVEI